MGLDARFALAKKPFYFLLNKALVKPTKTIRKRKSEFSGPPVFV